MKARQRSEVTAVAVWAVLATLLCAIAPSISAQESTASAAARFAVPAGVRIVRFQPEQSPCNDYAAAELVRLPRRLGVSAALSEEIAQTDHFALRIVASDNAPIAPPLVDAVRWDGFLLDVSETGVTIAARRPKGVLNGVYDLAERLGFLFLYPGLDGEWPPLNPPSSPSLPLGRRIVNPRFPHRGKTQQDDVKQGDYYMFSDWIAKELRGKAEGWEKELAR